MKIIYTESPGKDKDVCYRRPTPFFGVIASATEVVVEGDHPHIVEAYQARGIAVSDGSEPDEDERRQELMDAIEQATGRRPGVNTKTETLEQRYAELSEE